MGEAANLISIKLTAYVAVRRKHSGYGIKLPVSYWLPGKWPDKWRVLDVGACHLICFLSWLAIKSGLLHLTKLGLNAVSDIYSISTNCKSWSLRFANISGSHTGASSPLTGAPNTS
jgi:hypothetical protein